ncbi:zf-DHHC-domain-containing protein [Clathrospora elynae]|uniref:Palmitoyltransferase n=1 Tax=Clathrospora elynae TaxID=706981 RepID=A0A6A5SNV7_9PLEO|nr:zf-DHHC-domain-containing protein [Clathrospora elynae]
MAPPVVIGSQKPSTRNDTSATEQRVGQATSVIIPLLEFGAIGYVTWVVVYLICVQYLIDPSEAIQRDSSVQPRRATGIALIVVYALLLLLLLVPWLRLIQMIWSKPDLVPLGNQSREKMNTDTKGFAFDQYDAYTCDYQGTPLWCDKCHNWKPDRTHHCKELGRCVRKMDHYCPWAGGIIGESTHKFFMQFVSYAALYTTYLWIVTAVFLADRNSKMGSRPGTWIGALATGVMFWVFTFTMACMTGWNLMINFTSVEGIQRGGISNIAFLISRETPRDTSLPPTPPTPSSNDKEAPLADDEWPVLCTVQRSASRKYVVMQTKPMEHPWYTTLMMGWKDTMGNSAIDWFLPFKQSPCKQKSRKGEFEWGEVVYDMARKYEADNPDTQLALLEGTR